jgi:endothelin-converting enzyme
VEDFNWRMTIARNKAVGTHDLLFSILIVRVCLMRSSAVSTRSILSDITHGVVQDILDGPYRQRANLNGVNKTLHRANFDKLKAAYSACMDEEAIKKVGFTPLLAMLEELEGLYPAVAPKSPSVNSNKEELTNALLWLHQNSASSLVSSKSLP